MPTIADNAEAMAALVAKMKRDHKLTENTIMRIIDMNFALAQTAGIPSLSGAEDIPDFDEEGNVIQMDEVQMRMFPDDIDAAVERWQNENPDAIEQANLDAAEALIATTDHKEVN